MFLEAGDYKPFVIDKPLTIIGNGSVIRSEVQMPAITIEADDVVINGFEIVGVKRGSEEKFKYYMERFQGPSRASSTSAAYLRLDLPNAAILLAGDNITLENVNLRDAEVGVLAEDSYGLLINGSRFYSCKTGVLILRSSDVIVASSNMIGCEKAGLNASNSKNLKVIGSRAINNTHAGLFFRNCENITVADNILSKNSEGLVLWGTNQSYVSGNRADLNYYGILIADSHKNTIVENDLVNNRRSEIVSGFGVGISIQSNSSYNLVLKNRATSNYNGIEITEKCQKNALCGNNISRNTHGIRLDKNYNNLIYRNNLLDNIMSGYDNETHNCWNTTVGNYYSDYRGDDINGDGIGETPYKIPKGSTEAFDYRPLMRPFGGDLSISEILEDIERYATYNPEDSKTVSVSESGAAISHKIRRGPPVFKDDANVVERPPFTPVI